MISKKLKIAGVSITLSWLALLSLGIWVKALGIMFNDFFGAHVTAILVVSSIMVLFFVIVGIVSLKSMFSGVKNNVV